MAKISIKKKYIFLGDYDSINIEIICKSFSLLKNKVKYIIIGNKDDLQKYQKKIKNNLKINTIIDPYDFDKVDTNFLNIFNIDHISKKKFENLLNQIKIANLISRNTGIDLITMAIDKSLFKKKTSFIGMTEYLAEINKEKTIMLLYGDNFSVIPLTTHINVKDVHFFIESKKLKSNLVFLLKSIREKQYALNFKIIKFLCYNPHCGENRTIGNEDYIIKKTLKLFKNIKGPFSADSLFYKFKKNTLFISTYHDQVLIPFKALNKKMINITLGLKYRRLSPAHGTAKDIKFKNKANIISFIECMKI
jgi:4-hydroxythreonine-4-phosphate dehydrogenase